MTPTNIETLAQTPEEVAAYQARFLADGPLVTMEALRRHAEAHGPYMVAETAWAHGLTSPVHQVDPPTLVRRRR